MEKLGSLIAMFKSQRGLVMFGTATGVVLIDSIFYGELTVTFWNFINVNVVHGVAESFGVKGPLWYFYAVRVYECR